MASLPAQLASEIDALAAVAGQSKSLDSIDCWFTGNTDCIPILRRYINNSTTNLYCGVLVSTTNGGSSAARHVIVAHHTMTPEITGEASPVGIEFDFVG